MTDLDPLRIGGWPPCARLLAVAVSADVGAALIDANGDLAAIELERYERDADGRWVDTLNGSSGDRGATVVGDVVLAWGHAESGAVLVRIAGVEHRVEPSESGWWLFVERYGGPDPQVVVEPVPTENEKRP